MPRVTRFAPTATRRPRRSTGLRLAAGPTAAQVSGEIALELALGLDEERLVDRLVRHPHPRVAWIEHRQHRGDLLRRPVCPQQLPHLLPQRAIVQPPGLGSPSTHHSLPPRPLRAVPAAISLSPTTSGPRPRGTHTERPRPTQLPTDRRAVLADQRRDRGLRQPHLIRPLHHQPLISVNLSPGTRRNLSPHDRVATTG